MPQRTAVVPAVGEAVPLPLDRIRPEQGAQPVAVRVLSGTASTASLEPPATGILAELPDDPHRGGRDRPVWLVEETGLIVTVGQLAEQFFRTLDSTPNGRDLRPSRAPWLLHVL